MDSEENWKKVFTVKDNCLLVTKSLQIKKQRKQEKIKEKRKKPKIQYSPPSLKVWTKSVQDNSRKKTQIYTRPESYHCVVKIFINIS